MPDILIVEDEQVIRRALRKLLEDNGFEVAEALSVPDAEDQYDIDGFDLVISELRLPGPPGTELIQRYQVPVLIVTSYASIKSAVEAIRLGAADYIAKPFNHDELLHSVRRILDRHRLERHNAALKSDPQRDYPVTGVIGSCPAITQVVAMIHEVAPGDKPVLLRGEPGTGKELVARTIHEHSPRRDAPMITMSCAAIPEKRMETELFGLEQADADAPGGREGLLLAADGGTLFLDEIGGLPMTAQARLLEVLATGELQRPGSARAPRVDVRLIAASHRDLAQRVRQGHFREDLYLRLRGNEIRLPALRERGEDIVELAEYMLEKACQRLNHAPMRFAPDAWEAIRRYHWPGNVRELENAVERAVILNEGRIVTAELLALHTGAERGGENGEVEGPANMSLDDYFLYFVLSNQDKLSETEIAKRLGISRKSLWERRQRLGIPKPRGKRGGPQAKAD